MSYIYIGIIFAGSINGFSYAKYEWKKKNKLAAIGVVMFLLISVILPSILILSR